MLIRTRLWLLALLPVPVLLSLAVKVIDSEVSLRHERQNIVQLVRAENAAHALAQALYAKRDYESRTASINARGLEALMAGGLSATNSDADDLARQLDSNVDASLKALVDNFSGEQNTPTAHAIERIVNARRAISAPRNGHSNLRSALAPYEEILQLLGHFGDTAANISDSRKGIKGLRELAVAERLQNQLALEKIFVRHAIITHTFSPEIARAFASNQSELEKRRYELVEIFGTRLSGDRIDAAMKLADESGRSSVLSSLQGFTGRLDLLNALNQALGFGGLIHSFKDYLMRGEPRYRVLASARAAAALGLLSELEQNSGLSAAERSDAKTMLAAVQRLNDQLAPVKQGWDKREAPAQIDQRLRVDDESAIEALTRLSSVRTSISAEEWIEISDALNLSVEQTRSQIASQLSVEAGQAAAQSARALALTTFSVILTLLLLAFLGWRTSSRMNRGIRLLVNEFEHAARSGDISLPQLIDGHDELAQINASVSAIGTRLRALSDEAEKMAEGDYSGSMEPLSSDDRLAHAMRAVSGSALEVVAQAKTISEGNYETVVTPRSERDHLAHSLSDMAAALRRMQVGMLKSQWLNEKRLEVFEALRGINLVPDLADRTLGTLLPVSGALSAAFYELKKDRMQVICSRGVRAGQAIQDGGLIDHLPVTEQTRVIDKLPGNYLKLASALGEAKAQAVSLTPLLARGEVVGAIELGWTGTPAANSIELLDSLSASLGLALTVSQARARTEDLLTETQALAARLQTQQDELRQSNEELESQTQLLRQSEEELKSQREELQTSNEELEEKADLLQKHRTQLEKTAAELSQATRYKSEFLANMSHELRTPLNSMLILSKMLLDNDEKNLTTEQLESTEIIYQGGRDLLRLINDILDLSKVEAGMLAIRSENISIPDIINDLKRQFAPVAAEKNLLLITECDDAIPPEMIGDRQRIEQILRNLISNGLKFTKSGEVRLRISRPDPAIIPKKLEASGPHIEFRVQDTGIGIPADKLSLVFEAFQQADGATNRRYGGTGLGLTIALQMTHLLGGELIAKSEVGKGSVFSLILPQKMSSTGVQGTIRRPIKTDAIEAVPAPEQPVPPKLHTPAPEPEVAPTEEEIERTLEDDRDALNEGDRVILVVEDDAYFAAILLKRIRKRGFKCIIALSGASGLRLAKKHKPDAIILDLGLPDIGGLTVLESLKGAANTRHIPVHIVSASDPSTEPLKRGAIGFAHKPLQEEGISDVLTRLEALISDRQRVVLLIEDDHGSRRAVSALLSNDKTRVLTAETGEEALDILQQESIDCIVLDLSLPDTDGIEFLKKLRKLGAPGGAGIHPPVVIYTGRDLSKEEHQTLSEAAQSVVIKGAASPERLLDEVVLFLHSVESQLPEQQRQIVARLHGGPDAFAGRKVLLVDDDMRNTFAIGSILKKRGFDIVTADNGLVAIERLQASPDIEIVLMDVMMPVMDGLEATRTIRAQERFKDLPIIALTARAMPEDRRKCLDAGASDYLSKPIDNEQLMGMLKVWLSRE